MALRASSSSLSKEKDYSPSPRKTILIELDGTLAIYRGWRGIEHIGEPFAGAAEFTQNLTKIGKVVVHTARTNPDLPGRSMWAVSKGIDPTNRPAIQWALFEIVEAWLKSHKIYYDEILMENPKPFYSVVLDSRALKCAPGEDPNTYDNILFSVASLCAK